MGGFGLEFGVVGEQALREVDGDAEVDGSDGRGEQLAH